MRRRRGVGGWSQSANRVTVVITLAVFTCLVCELDYDGEGGGGGGWGGRGGETPGGGGGGGGGRG